MASQSSEIKTVRVVKNFKQVLKDFEPMVKDPRHLWNGRDISNFTLRPREAWANWLICAVMRHLQGEDVTFADHDVADGLIVDERTGGVIVTEHVSALEIPKGKKRPSGEQRIIDAIQEKVARGPEYAAGKYLVVFFDGAGWFVRQKVREAIYGNHNFVSVFCVGLLDSGPTGYTYIATEFKDAYGDKSASFKIEITIDFTDWKITKVTA